MAIRALTFDVFGTVVDWRSSVVRELQRFGRGRDLDLDWPAFADEWRALYQPLMEQVRSGARPWTVLDELHREGLETLLEQHAVGALTAGELDLLTRAWHRLDPWPDVCQGLRRLKRRFVLATLSNGNVALLVNMAKRAGLPWDAVLGAEPARCYKPMPDAYLRTARYLGLAPEECLMVAAHNADLAAAAELGFATAFVLRASEHGPAQTSDLRPAHEFHFVAESFIDLAAQLGT